MGTVRQPGRRPGGCRGRLTLVVGTHPTPIIINTDMVVGAVAALEEDAQLRSRWQARFGHLCVDEFQDVDAAQLRLIRLLAAPGTTCSSLVMMISRSS